MRIVTLPATSLLALASLAAPAAQAQSYQAQSYPSQSYPAQSYAPGYGQQFRDAPRYDDVAPGPDDADLAPPPGYDGTQPPPPPPGYVAAQDDGRYGGADAAQGGYVPTEQDRRYEAYVEDWSQRYCVRARSNAGAGAVIGGLFGALLGAGVSGRHDQGTGALVGGLAGAAGGAVVGGSTANQTSPGCPPGFVVRGGAPAFYYDGYDSGYAYAAPGWYRPWAFYDGRWAYRPYPYHAFYYAHYGYGRPYGYRGGFRGGYRAYGGYRGRR